MNLVITLIITEIVCNNAKQLKKNTFLNSLTCLYALIRCNAVPIFNTMMADFQKRLRYLNNLQKVVQSILTG